MITIGLLMSALSFVIGFLAFFAALNMPIVPKSMGVILATCILGVVGGLVLALAGVVMAALL